MANTRCRPWRMFGSDVTGHVHDGRRGGSLQLPVASERGQVRSLQQVFDSCRFVWNTALGRWSDLWRYEQSRLGFADMSRELTDWRSRFDWLAAVPVTPQQQVLRDLDKSIRAFYDKDNPGRRPGSNGSPMPPRRGL